MSSQTDPDPGARTHRTSTDDRADSEEEPPSSVICAVCQRPIDSETTHTWRQDPVHPECSAELRCGISLGEPSDD